MSKSNNTETDFVSYVLTGVAPPWDGAANLDVHLHTADPGEFGTTASSAASYGGYAAVTVARSGSAWTVAGGSGTNVAEIQFPECVSGSDTVTHVSVSASGSSQILYYGSCGPLAVTPGIQPYFAAGDLTIQEL